jgi:hypothetical protein
MRLASFLVLTLPLLLAHCGSKQDLVIGEIRSLSEAGTTSVTAGSAGVAAAGGVNAVSGAGGTTDVGGSTDTGGTQALGGAAGAAGMGHDDCVTGAEPPLQSLIHRYRFDDSGTTALDAISGADGNVVGTTLDGNGLVTMSGDGREYVDLPNGIVSSLTDVTIVAWMTWTGGAAYQRIFDFGSSDNGEGLGMSGRSYLAVLPMTGFEDQAKPGLGAELKAPGFPTVTLASVEDMDDRFAQVSLVFKSGVSAALYLDGTLLATEPTTITLADIDDRNNWIGQSQWQNDPVFQGSYEEFRIYDVALDACQLHTLLVRGPQTP